MLAITPKQTRRLMRLLHLAVAVVAGLVIYLPLIPAETARLVLAVGVIPLLALSGVGLWQQARLRRLISGRPA